MDHFTDPDDWIGLDRSAWWSNWLRYGAVVGWESIVMKQKHRSEKWLVWKERKRNIGIPRSDRNGRNSRPNEILECLVSAWLKPKRPNDWKARMHGCAQRWWYTFIFSSGLAVNALRLGPNVKRDVEKEKVFSRLYTGQWWATILSNTLALQASIHTTHNRNKTNKPNKQTQTKTKGADMQLPRSELRVSLVATTHNTKKGPGPHKQKRDWCLQPHSRATIELMMSTYLEKGGGHSQTSPSMAIKTKHLQKKLNKDDCS